MTAPTIGRIVLYTLTDDDAARINKRREDFKVHIERESYLDTGYVAHWGNMATPGEVFPMLVVRVDGGSAVVNGQVFLDGADTLWKVAVPNGPDMGEWEWPVIMPQSR